MLDLIASNPLEYTHRVQCAVVTETGADALAPKLFFDCCACRRHQCCLFMMMNENPGVFSLRQHQTSYCLPVSYYVETAAVKRKPMVEISLSPLPLTAARFAHQFTEGERLAAVNLREMQLPSTKTAAL